MNRRSFLTVLMLAGLGSLSLPASSADQQTIYGSQLMTQQERNEHRNRMRNAKNEQERQQIRNEHHKRMQIRAKEQGVSLPDEPPQRGKGMGGGMGQGGGQGSGQGNAQGGGQGKNR